MKFKSDEQRRAVMARLRERGYPPPPARSRGKGRDLREYLSLREANLGLDVWNWDTQTGTGYSPAAAPAPAAHAVPLTPPTHSARRGHFRDVFKGKPQVVILDLDDTLWDGSLYRTTPPYKRLGKYTIADLDGNKIRIYPEAMRIVREARRRKIPVAINSQNSPKNGEAAFKALGIGHLFSAVRVNWQAKGENARSILAELRAKRKALKVVDPDQVVFLDDNPANLGGVSAAIGARTFLPGWELPQKDKLAAKYKMAAYAAAGPRDEWAELARKSAGGATPVPTDTRKVLVSAIGKPQRTFYFPDTEKADEFVDGLVKLSPKPTADVEAYQAERAPPAATPVTPTPSVITTAELPGYVKEMVREAKPGQATPERFKKMVWDEAKRRNLSPGQLEEVCRPLFSDVHFLSYQPWAQKAEIQSKAAEQYAAEKEKAEPEESDFKLAFRHRAAVMLKPGDIRVNLSWPHPAYPSGYTPYGVEARNRGTHVFKTPEDAHAFAEEWHKRHPDGKLTFTRIYGKSEKGQVREQPAKPKGGLLGGDKDLAKKVYEWTRDKDLAKKVYEWTKRLGWQPPTRRRKGEP